jgi:hypothetical protein
LDIGIFEGCAVLEEKFEARTIGSVSRDFDGVGVYCCTLVLDLGASGVNENFWEVPNVGVGLDFFLVLDF